MKLFLSTLCLGGAAAAGSAGLQDPVATDAPRSVAVRLAPSAVASTADAPQEGARRLAALGYVSTQDDETKQLEKAAKELEGEVARLREELESMRKRLAEEDTSRTDARDRMEAARRNAELTRRALEETRARTEEMRARAEADRERIRFTEEERIRFTQERQRRGDEAERTRDQRRVIVERQQQEQRARLREQQERIERRLRGFTAEHSKVRALKEQLAALEQLEEAMASKAKISEIKFELEGHAKGSSAGKQDSVQTWLTRSGGSGGNAAPTSITIHVEEGDVHIHADGSSIQTRGGSGSSKASGGGKDRVSGLGEQVRIGSKFPDEMKTRVFTIEGKKLKVNFPEDSVEIIKDAESLDGHVLELKDSPVGRILASEEIESTVAEALEGALENVRGRRFVFGDDAPSIHVFETKKAFEGDGGTVEMHVWKDGELFDIKSRDFGDFGVAVTPIDVWRVFGVDDEEVEAIEIEELEIEEVEEILEEVEASEHRFVFGLSGAAAGGIVPAAASGFSFGGAAAAPAPAGDELLDLAREIRDELRAMRAELEALRSDLTAGPAGRTAPAAFFAAPAPPPATPARPTAPAHPSAPAPPSPPSIPVAAPPAPPAADGFLVGRGEFPTPPAAPAPPAARGGR